MNGEWTLGNFAARALWAHSVPRVNIVAAVTLLAALRKLRRGELAVDFRNSFIINPR
jgi:hypothetical protein